MHAVKLRTQHGNKLGSIVAKFVNILLKSYQKNISANMKCCFIISIQWILDLEIIQFHITIYVYCTCIIKTHD